jgi:hypothetical protein
MSGTGRVEPVRAPRPNSVGEASALVSPPPGPRGGLPHCRPRTSARTSAADPVALPGSWWSDDSTAMAGSPTRPAAAVGSACSAHPVRRRVAVAVRAPCLGGLDNVAQFTETGVDSVRVSVSVDRGETVNAELLRCVAEEDREEVIGRRHGSTPGTANCDAEVVAVRDPQRMAVMAQSRAVVKRSRRR